MPFNFAPKSNNVIGLHFGTSTLCVSYMMSAYHVPFMVKMFEADIDFSAPNVLLIDENNEVKIGNEALHCYRELKVDFSHSIFFENIKLDHNKVYT